MRKSSRYLIVLVVLTALIAAGTVATWLARPRGWTGNLEGYPVTACPYHFEYGDFDNDGKTDLMTFGFMGMVAGNVHVYFGPLARVQGWRRSNPFSRFWKNVGLGAELDPLFGCLLVTATDYNNDGFTDFAGSLFSFGVMIWMMNSGGRTFEQDNSPVVPEHLVSEAEGGIRRMRFPDLNGDGAADLFAQLEQGKGVIALGGKGGGFSGEHVVFACPDQEVWCCPDGPAKNKPVFYFLGTRRDGAEPIIDGEVSAFLKRLDASVQVGIISPEPRDPGPGWFHDIESHWVLGGKEDVRLWLVIVIPTWEPEGWKRTAVEPRLFAFRAGYAATPWVLFDSQHLPVESYVWDTGDFEKYTYTNYDRFSVLYVGEARRPALLTPSGYAYWISTEKAPVLKFWKRFVFPKGRGKAGYGRAVVADVTDDGNLDLVCTYRPWENVIRGPLK